MKRLVVLLAVLVLGAGACAYGGTPLDPAAMTVNGTSVSRRALEDELAFLAARPEVAQALFGPQQSVQGEVAGSYDPQLAAGLLELHLQSQLFDQIRQEQGAEITDNVRQQADQALAGSFDPEGQVVVDAMPASLRTMLHTFLVSRIAVFEHLQAAEAPEVTDDQVRAAYEAQKDQLLEVCASHVLVSFADDMEQLRDPAFEPTEEQEAAALEGIEAAAERLAAGEDFATVAAELSDDSGSAAQGGELGCANPAQYVPEFAQAATEQPVGEVGEPFRTQFGYHVLLVTERTEPSFDDLEAQIREQLESQAADPEGRFSQLVADAAADLDVTIDPRFGRWDPTRGIVPPEGAAEPPAQQPDLADDPLAGLGQP